MSTTTDVNGVVATITNPEDLTQVDTLDGVGIVCVSGTELKNVQLSRVEARFQNTMNAAVRGTTFAVDENGHLILTQTTTD